MLCAGTAAKEPYAGAGMRGEPLTAVCRQPWKRDLSGSRMGRGILHVVTTSCLVSMMEEERPVVFVIDDDASVRDGVADLIRSVGLDVESFGSAQEFLASQRPDAPGCIVLDVRLPGASGLEVQRELMKSSIHLPIIFISGHGDIPMSVRAMKSGAIEFLTKPLREQELLDAVQAGIEHDRARRREAKLVAELRERFKSLTSREHEVLALVVTGRPNKQIAAQLELSEQTVKVHRSQIMRKMRAKSLVDLVRMADKLGVSTQ
jgi:FixJ family two-component response regulator